MTNPLQRPLMRIELELADGETLVRECSMEDIDNDVDSIPVFMRPGRQSKPPEFIQIVNREWPDPQGPVTVHALCVDGHEDEAREMLGIE